MSNLDLLGSAVESLDRIESGQGNRLGLRPHPTVPSRLEPGSSFFSQRERTKTNYSKEPARGHMNFHELPDQLSVP